jgi:ABC-type lipoprotein export system ATPase subunit
VSTRSPASRSRSSRRSQRARIRNRQIGFIFQAFNLIGDLTVYENVELRSRTAACRRPSASSASRMRSSASA